MLMFDWKHQNGPLDRMTEVEFEKFQELCGTDHVTPMKDIEEEEEEEEEGGGGEKKRKGSREGKSWPRSEKFL